jgi:hypothetical protein
VLKSENNRAGELKELGWSAEDVRRYEELWEYRQRWGAINLERDDRQFLRKAEAALPKIVAKGSEKKRTQDKSHYRWLAFYLEAMQAAPVNEGEVGAWPIVLQEELRTIDYYEPVLGLPDTLKAKELLPIRERLVAQAAAAGRSTSFDFVAPLDELKQRETVSWKPLRGEGNTDTSYPVLSADAAETFRNEVRATITSSIRALFPSLKDTDKPAPPADWMP